MQKLQLPQLRLFYDVERFENKNVTEFVGKTKIAKLTVIVCQPELLGRWFELMGGKSWQ